VSTHELPQSVLDLVELSPVEEILLVILRDGLPDVPVYSQIPKNAPPTFITARRMPGLGTWEGDPRFIDAGRFYVHTFTSDPDGDAKGALLSEAVRVVLRNAWLEHRNLPGLGSIVSIKMNSEPSRKTDWATATGPVQYADLPTGYWRYESQYEIRVRKPR
jgi:hypothetical protein